MDGFNFNNSTWDDGLNRGQWIAAQNGEWMGGFGYGGGMLHDAADLISGNFAHQYTAFPPSPPPLADDAVRPSRHALSMQEAAPRFIMQQTAAGRPRTYDMPQQSPPRTPTPVRGSERPTSATEVLQLSPRASVKLNKKRSRGDIEPASDVSEPEIAVVGESRGGKENKKKRVKSKSDAKTAKVSTIALDDEADVGDRAKRHWTVKELDILVEVTLGDKVSNETFNWLMANNRQSWQKIADTYFKGSRSSEACCNQIRRMRGVWTAVKAYFEFTGGSGDGDEDADADRTSDLYVDRRLEQVKNAKQDSNVGKLTRHMIRQWEQGNNWMPLFQRRFGKNPAVVRATHRHSGRLSPPPGTSRRKATDSDSNSDTESESGGESEAVADTARKPPSSKAAAPKSRKGGVPEPPFTPKTPAAAMSQSFESIGRFVDSQREMTELHKQEQKLKLAKMILELPGSTEEQKAKARGVIDKLTDLLDSC